MSQIELGKLRRDGGTQPRQAIDLVVVEQYADAMADGAIFPPVIVFCDSEYFWLAD